MTVRFRVADSKEKVPSNATDKIRAHLESKGHRTIHGYISYNGLVNIFMADSHSATLSLLLAPTLYHPYLKMDCMYRLSNSSRLTALSS